MLRPARRRQTGGSAGTSFLDGDSAITPSLGNGVLDWSAVCRRQCFCAIAYLARLMGVTKSYQKQGQGGDCQVIDAWHRECVVSISGLRLHFFVFIFYMIPHLRFFTLSFEVFATRQRQCSCAIAGTACLDRDLCWRQCFCAIVGPGSWASNLWL